MAIKIEHKGNYLTFTDSVTSLIYEYPSIYLRYTADGDVFNFYNTNTGTSFLYHVDDLTDENDVAWSTSGLETWLQKNTAITGTLDVLLQDSTAPIIITHFTNLVTETTLTAVTAKDDYVINVTSAASFVVGQVLTIYSIAANRVFFSHILAINTLAITLDSPLDFEFQIGDYVSVGNDDMSVDGSTTPVIFGVRNPTTEDIPLAVDITRIIFAIECAGAVNLSQFGDIAGGLLRGVVLRKTDGTYRNIFNAKTNAELKSIMYDVDIQTAVGVQPAGITGRLTFGGQEKLGAVIRLESNEDLQIIIQDDLTDLTRFIIMAEGSEVVD